VNSLLFPPKFKLGKEWSLVLIHYNQNERIPISLKYWREQSIPPTEIILLDDGSLIKPDLHAQGRESISVFHLEHTGNIGAILNKGIDATHTPIFMTAEPSLLPVGKYFAEKQLARLEKGSFHIPIYAITSSLPMLDIGNIDAFDHTFGQNQRTSTRFGVWNIPDLQTPRKIEGMWYPVEGHFTAKADFLRYNEKYTCWGFYDLDLAVRYYLKGIQIFTQDESAICHWNHPRIGNWYDRAKTQPLFDFCKRYYEAYKITTLDKQTENKIWQEYCDVHQAA